MLYNYYKEIINLGFWCDKGSTHSYIPIYESIFAPLKNLQLTIVEAGVFDGGSLLLWNNYFSNANIIGLDIRKWKNFEQANFEKILSQNKRISFIQADATSPEILNYIPKNIDIFIDDASHIYEDQIKTYDIIYPLINKNGLYIIEDIKPEAISNLFLNLNKNQNAHLIDLRLLKNRYDDVILICKKL